MDRGDPQSPPPRALVRREATAAEARYQALFEGMADAVVVADEARRYVDANPAATMLLGYTREEFLALLIDDIVAAPAAWSAAEFDRFTRGNQWRGEIEVRRKDGAVIPIEADAAVVRLPDRTLYVAALRDISNRRSLERLQREFLAIVTHELKNPLAGIGGYAQLMRRRARYDERAVEAILSQCARLDRLIDDLLDVASVEAGRLVLRRARIDLVALTRTIIDQAQSLTSLHAIRLDASGSSLEGRWDSDRLAQVVQNLLMNAIKYAPHGGDIGLRLEERAGAAHIAVTDQGIGIPSEALPHLFTRFYRTRGARESGAEGLGLGLYISRALVEAHGGRIWAESAGSGHGTTFHVTIPIAAPGSGNPDVSTDG